MREQVTIAVPEYDVRDYLLVAGVILDLGPRPLEGARVRSHRDHRVAMALAVAGLLADGTTEIEDADCVEISYPGFFDQLESLC